MIKKIQMFIFILCLLFPVCSLKAEVNGVNDFNRVAFLPTFTMEEQPEWEYVKPPYQNNKSLLDKPKRFSPWHFEILNSYYYHSSSLYGINTDVKFKYKVSTGAEFNFLWLNETEQPDINYNLYSFYFIPFSIALPYSAFEPKLGGRKLRQEKSISGYSFGFNYELLPLKPFTFDLSMEHAYLDERPFYDINFVSGFYWRQFNFFIGYRYLKAKAIPLSGTQAGVKFNF